MLATINCMYVYRRIIHITTHFFLHPFPSLDAPFLVPRVWSVKHDWVHRGNFRPIFATQVRIVVWFRILQTYRDAFLEPLFTTLSLLLNQIFLSSYVFCLSLNETLYSYVAVNWLTTLKRAIIYYSNLECKGANKKGLESSGVSL